MDTNHKNTASAYGSDYLSSAREVAKKRGLNIKIVSFTEDDEGLIFSLEKGITAGLEELADDLKTLFGRQINFQEASSRDKAAVIGGVGPCGQILCCKKWLQKPINVPIKILAEENLTGNPAGYTGSCGNLMCCLTYENANFKCPARDHLTPEMKTENQKEPEKENKPKEEHRKKIRRLILKR
jgi:cell fate regulator YaaT (PSP1 superfamily)